MFHLLPWNLDLLFTIKNSNLVNVLSGEVNVYRQNTNILGPAHRGGMGGPIEQAVCWHVESWVTTDQFSDNLAGILGTPNQPVNRQIVFVSILKPNWDFLTPPLPLSLKEVFKIILL